MSWVAVAVTAGTTALGAYAGDQKERAQAKRNNAAAEANRYSPWTGKSIGQDFSADGGGLGGAIQGASSGLMLGQGIKRLNAGNMVGRDVSAGGWDDEMIKKQGSMA